MSCSCLQEGPSSAIDQATISGQDIFPSSSPTAAVGTSEEHSPFSIVGRTDMQRDQDRATKDTPFDLTFRVTGATSVARLEPLLLGRHWGERHRLTWWRALNGDSGGAVNSASIDFVWETTVSKQQRVEHRNARVLNRLSGAQVSACVSCECHVSSH